MAECPADEIKWVPKSDAVQIAELAAIVTRLEGEVAAKDAALRLALSHLEDCAHHQTTEYLGSPGEAVLAARAALSGTGEGWAEVRERAARKVRRARLELDSPSIRRSDALVQNAVDYARRSLDAALAALEVT